MCCAQATPATVTWPAVTVLRRFGTSMRDSVLIGACWDHAGVCLTQYALNAPNVVNSMSTTHLVADT